MRTGRLRKWAGLGVVALLAAGAARAQEHAAPMPVPAAGGYPVAQPIHAGGEGGHGAHGGGHEGSFAGHEGCAKCEEECRGGGLFASFEVLAIHARRRAFDFAIIDPADNFIAQGRIQNLDWMTDVGFRGGLGVRTSGGWEVGLFYFYFHTDDQLTVTAPAGGTLYTTLLPPAAGLGTAQVATGATSLDMDVIDLEIGRRVHLGESLGLRLFGGGRFAIIDQDLSAAYDGGTTTRAFARSPVNMDAYGLRAGGESHLTLGSGWSVYSKAATSLLVADIRNTFVATNSGGAFLLADVSEKYDQILPVVEVGIGLGYEGERVFFSFGYELTNYINFIDSPDFVDDVHEGKLQRRTSDLMLEALVLRLGLTY